MKGFPIEAQPNSRAFSLYQNPSNARKANAGRGFPGPASDDFYVGSIPRRND